MAYILNWEGLMMMKHKGHVLNNLDGSTSYWQYRFNSAEDGKSHPYNQSAQDSSDSWSLWLGLIFTVGFLALLIITTLRSIL